MNLLNTLPVVISTELFEEMRSELLPIEQITEIFNDLFLRDAHLKYRELEPKVHNIVDDNVLYGIVYDVQTNDVRFLMALSQLVAAYSDRPVVLIGVRSHWDFQSARLAYAVVDVDPI